MPLLMTLLQSSWKTLLIGFIVAAIWGLGFDIGAEHIQRKWDASISAAKDTARNTEYQNVIFSNQIGGKYEANIQTIDDTYRSVLAGLPTNASSSLPTATNPTSESDTTACRNAVYQENKRLRLELARQAEINTQRLVALQEWVKEVIAKSE